MRLNLDPDPDGAATGGGQAPDWTANLPAEVKPFVQSKGWKAPTDAISSYQNLEKLIGSARLPAPQKDWKDEQWADFYSKIGRPENPEKYTMPNIQLAEGISMDAAKLNDAKTHMHKLGLTDKQAGGMLEWYMNFLNEGDKGLKESISASQAQAEATLKQEWGDKYDANLDMARAVVRKFGTEELSQTLVATGKGNDPALVKFLHNIGKAMLEDTAGGKGAGLQIQDATGALAEINRLKGDKEFMTKFMTNGPGHKEAVAIWTELHNRAFPEKRPE